MKLALATLATFATASGAALAGGYSVPVTETPVVVAPVVTSSADWTGAYGGVTLGYSGSGDDDVGIDTSTGVGPLITPDSLHIKGANVGLRAGYRWQRDMGNTAAVFGAEIGVEGGPVKDEFTTDGYNAKSELKNAVALRLKGGVLNPERNMLFYGIAGVARGSFDYRVTDGGAVDIDGTSKHNGWVLGVGVERKLTDRMSVTGEIERMGFRKKTISDDADVFRTVVSPAYTTVKVGLNFSF